MTAYRDRCRVFAKKTSLTVRPAPNEKNRRKAGTHKKISARDGNRTRTSVAGNRILSPARLPVPPPGQHHHPKNKKFHRQTTNGIPGAEDEARTRDLNLGKVALYQLSYFRINFKPNNRGAKIRQIPHNLTICTEGYTTYYREPQPPVCPYSDARTIRKKLQKEKL